MSEDPGVYTTLITAVSAVLTAAIGAIVAIKTKNKKDDSDQVQSLKKQLNDFKHEVESLNKTIERKDNEQDQIECELDMQRTRLDFGKFMSEWGSVSKQIEDLLRRTELDRFLILRAWNGKTPPQWTTAVFQMRSAGQDVVQYIHFKLDYHYVELLHKIIVDGPVLLTVRNMPNSALRRVYESEGVKDSYICHLDTTEIDGRKLITYCSFATHEPVGIHPDVLTKCDIITGRLSGVAKAFS